MTTISHFRKIIKVEKAEDVWKNAEQKFRIVMEKAYPLGCSVLSKHHASYTVKGKVTSYCYETGYMVVTNDKTAKSHKAHWSSLILLEVKK